MKFSGRLPTIALFCSVAGCLPDPLHISRDAGRAETNDAACVADECDNDEADAGTVDGATGDAAGADGGMAATIPRGDWKNVTANLANMESECGNLTGLSAKPDEDLLIAGIALKGLWSSKNGGESWQPLGNGAGSAMIVNRPTAFLYDPADPNRFWEAGLYNGDGVLQTVDGGKTFKALGDIKHVDAVAVDFNDPARKLILAGGHETPQMLSRSSDGGATWDSIAAGLPANISCTYPFVISTDSYLVGCSYSGEGIYRTSDAGRTWRQVSAKGGSYVPLRMADVLYWAVKDNGGLVKSTDDGITWKAATGPGVLFTITPVALPDGRIATVGTNGIVVSADSGQTWQTVSKPLPYPDVTGFVYSRYQRAFFIKHFSCGATVPADAIMRFEYDYEAR